MAVIYRNHIKCSGVSLPFCDMFEAVCVRLTTASGPVILLNIYRPGSARPSAAFYELSSVLEQLVVHSCPLFNGGDLNVHVNDANDPDSRRLLYQSY